MAIAISSEWFDKLSVFTRDLFDVCKMKSFPYQSQNIEPCKKLLSGNSNLFEVIPSAVQKMLIENNWLYDDRLMNSPNLVSSEHIQQNSLLFPNILSSFEDKLLLSSNIFNRSQNIFNYSSLKKICIVSHKNSNDIIFNSLQKQKNYWLDSELDLVKEKFIPKEELHKDICSACKMEYKPSMSSIETKLTSKDLDSKCVVIEKTLAMELCDKQFKPFCELEVSEELVMRKTKELAKRSKKRRRRQKKKVVQSNNTVTDSKCELKGKIIRTPVEDKVNSHQILTCSPSHSSKNSDIMCVSFEDFKSGLELTFCDPVIATSDEDSDWEVNGHDQSLIEAEFEFSGIFVTSFTTFCELDHLLSLSPRDNTCKIFQSVCETSAALRNVNKLWREANKDLDSKSKLPSKVSFLPDDELVTTVYVEEYERKGEWETVATERLRFRKRILDFEQIIGPCFEAQHRINILKRNKTL